MNGNDDTLIRVLLVEDNPWDARLLREALAEVTSESFELTHAITLSEGMERLSVGRTDVVLLDLSLPDASGLDTFIRLHACAPSVPFVVLTGLADETVAAAALREGAQDYLVKGQVDSNLLSRSMRYAIERMRTEEALRESEERYRTLFADSRDAIFISSAEGKVIDANQAALDLFEFTNKQALESDVGDRYVDLADQDRFRQEISDAGSVRDFEVRLRKRDGAEIDCLLTATRSRAGGVQGIVRDITERKRAEETLLDQTRELAVLEERNRLAREIHDTLAQGFTGIVIQIEAAEQAMSKSPGELPDHLTLAKKLGRDSLQEARRSVWNLLPQALERLPLEAALEEEVKRFPGNGREKVFFTVSGEKRDLPANLQAALLRVCQESLTNVRRHAAATEIKVDVTFYPDAVSLAVQDDGVGFDVEAVRASGKEHSFGLAGMEGRINPLGGSYQVTSRHGEGTRVEVWVPTGVS